MMSNRKHLLFLIILWSIIGLSLFVFDIGLKRTIDASFGQRPDGKNEYTYELEIKNRQIVNVDSLTTRIKLNRLLSENSDYSSFYRTTGTVTKLVNTEIDVNNQKNKDKNENAAEGTSKDDVKTAQNYIVNVLFLDRNAAKNTPFADLFARTFEGDLDYDAEIPVLCGSAWKGEEYLKDKKGPVLSTDISDYSTNVLGYLTPGSETVELSGRSVDLSTYVIIPLRDLGSSNSVNEKANDKDRRSYWCKIYDLRNQGTIISSLKPDSLQMDINDKLSAAGLTDSFAIKIRGANYDSRILYNKKLDSIRPILNSGSKAALVIAGMMLVLYMYFTVQKNRRFIMVSYMNGTGKIEMWILCVVQVLIWIVSTVAVTYGIYYGIMKLLETDPVTIKEMVKPAAIIAGLSLLVATVRLLFMDAVKSLRRV